MQIDIDILFTWGAVARKYKKNEVIFFENESAFFYHQVIEGTVRMYNANEDGKEFTQGYFSSGQSFGEPPLFTDCKYPSTASCIQDCTILKLSKDKFLKILDAYPNLQKEFLKLMCLRILAKSNTTKDIVNQKPEHRIVSFLNSVKSKKKCGEKLIIPFTRQEIANFTGLRVETVIRSCTKLKEEKIIDIIDHKIYY
ncbi:Crp/Fnr family transcriptional regulator [Flavobacterium sp. H122]|uniref:Crp/Fnr family transcriptional regulator n=1 Tax=Flavobacterium sp. H122 TaxID=2529860 RepID=UPI0010AAFDDA|nr:Crp/Fnr family transcriptional regulator [Flavobacterium sp. H122]